MNTILAVGIFCTLIVLSYGLPKINTAIASTAANGADILRTVISQSYTPANLLILLAIMNGLMPYRAQLAFLL